MHIVNILPKMNAASFDLNDFKRSLYDYHCEKRKIIFKCSKCGKLLVPTFDLSGPYDCGWKKINNKWICHQCDCGWGGFDNPEETVKEINNKLTSQMIFYMRKYPWVKFRSYEKIKIEYDFKTRNARVI